MRDQFKQNITNENEPIKRRLSQKNVADLSAFMKFEIIRGAENSASIDDLGFEAFVLDFEPQQVVLQFLFKNPLMVSIGSKPDSMRITIINPNLFSS